MIRMRLCLMNIICGICTVRENDENKSNKGIGSGMDWQFVLLGAEVFRYGLKSLARL